jgi:tol-pal system protein YbgF
MRVQRHPWFLAAALVAAAFASGAQAQGRLSLSERVARLEQQAQGQGQAQTTVELLNRINELQVEVQSLRGLVEQQAFEIENLKKAQRDRYVDLDSRIARLEGSAGVAPPPGAVLEAPTSPTTPGQLAAEPLETVSAGTTPPDRLDAPPATPGTPGDAPSVPVGPTAGAASEKAAYDEAFAALRDGRYAESARRFQGFLTDHPQGELADNALYWLGESYYVTQNYRIALDTFNDLLARFPGSAKAPDALLKVGYCHYELKEWPQAEQVLNEVVRLYPEQTVGKLAQGRLRALRLEGQR